MIKEDNLGHTNKLSLTRYEVGRLYSQEFSELSAWGTIK